MVQTTMALSLTQILAGFFKNSDIPAAWFAICCAYNRTSSQMSSEVSEDRVTDTVFRHLILNHIEDAKRLEVFQYFGTASRSMFTMFELTLATLGILFC